MRILFFVFYTCIFLWSQIAFASPASEILENLYKFISGKYPISHEAQETVVFTERSAGPGGPVMIGANTRISIINTSNVKIEIYELTHQSSDGKTLLGSAIDLKIRVNGANELQKFQNERAFAGFASQLLTSERHAILRAAELNAINSRIFVQENVFRFDATKFTAAEFKRFVGDLIHHFHTK